MKTTQKHREEGTYNATRHGGRLEAEPLRTPPPPPADLPPVARKIWVTEVKDLFPLGTITAKDIPALRELVVQVYYMHLAAADLEKNGLIIEAELKAGTKTIANPAWRIYQDASRMVLALRKEFGSTPMSGQRFASPEPEKEYNPVLDSLFSKSKQQ